MERSDFGSYAMAMAMAMADTETLATSERHSCVSQCVCMPGRPPTSFVGRRRRRRPKRRVGTGRVWMEMGRSPALVPTRAATGGHYSFAPRMSSA